MLFRTRLGSMLETNIFEKTRFFRHIFSASEKMNGTPQSNFSDEPWRKYHDRIDDNFTKNGKRNEIVEQTRQQLYQSKWADEVQEKFQKFVKSKGWKESEITEQQMTQICDALRDDLRRTIPSQVKQDVMAYVTDYVDTQITDIKRDLRRRD
ncbi:hypothetical protein M3Y97_00347800 [Aphelenchoides bicaudatus]|nr:hypothetical protein M3Y97_00347800 [Aphelenchoides bicaudatus]